MKSLKDILAVIVGLIAAAGAIYYFYRFVTSPEAEGGHSLGWMSLGFAVVAFIFGLVYFNHEPRGGTLFFRNVADTPGSAPSPGYLTDSRDGFELAGRIEPAFNRLAIYPGFVPHSGEIAGDWIRSDERFTNPRLTQRLLFG